MANDVSFLYHGSSHRIKGEITCHRGRNPDGRNEGNRFGIYATPDFPTAMVFSMDARRTSFFRPKVLYIDYLQDTIRVQFQNCFWKRNMGYVYTVPAAPFEKLNDVEYISSENVPILSRKTITPTEIEKTIADGKLIIVQDHRPNSALLRLGLSAVDTLIACSSTIRHFYNVLLHSIKKC